MAKLTSKEKKQKKDIAKQIMDAYEMNYNDWLHQKHEEFIDENLMDYMKMQGGQKHQEEDDEEDDLPYDTSSVSKEIKTN